MMIKESHIEALTSTLLFNYDMTEEFAKGLAEFLYDEGYRKQVEGNWIPAGDFHNDFYKCSNCDNHVHRDLIHHIKFCMDCGAHMSREIKMGD